MIGYAAVNTGNNLLYLLLGAMLGFITLSGWLSERVLHATGLFKTMTPPKLHGISGSRTVALASASPETS